MNTYMYNYCLEFYVTASLSLIMLRFDAILSDLYKGPICIHCNYIIEKLNEPDPVVVEIFEDIQSWYTQAMPDRLKKLRHFGSLHSS